MAILSRKKTEEKVEKAEVQTPAPKLKENTGDAYLILLRPLVTEKSFKGQAKGKISFKVHPKANKISIRKAIEKVYDLKVQDVNVISMRGKSRNFGGRRGTTSDWKKAIVTLKPGQNITGNIEGAQV